MNEEKNGHIILELHIHNRVHHQITVEYSSIYGCVDSMRGLGKNSDHMYNVPRTVATESKSLLRNRRQVIFSSVRRHNPE